MNNRILIALGVVALVFSSVQPGLGQDNETWDGGDSADYWNWNNNWADNTAPNGNDILNFAGSTRTINTNNFTFNGYRIFFNSGAASFTLRGNNHRLVDFGGNDPKIENNAANAQTIDFVVGGDGDAGDPLELNPVSGNLTFNGVVSNFNSDIFIYGDNAKTITFNGIVTGSGKLILKQNSTAIFAAANAYTGNTEIDEGEIWISDSGDISGSSAIYVGNGAATANICKFFINNSSGGRNFTRAININAGDGTTSNREIGG